MSSSSDRCRTMGARKSSTTLPAASGAYVQPRPHDAPERASTTTIVVESHSSVPSDSGASVGIVNAETVQRLDRAHRPGRNSSIFCLNDSVIRCRELGSPLRRGHERLRLFERDVRRKRRDLGIHDRVDHERPVGGEGLLPGGVDAVRGLDPHALEADHPRELRVTHVGDLLRRADSSGRPPSRAAPTSPGSGRGC